MNFGEKEFRYVHKKSIKYETSELKKKHVKVFEIFGIE